jgi:hypothetical protein
MSGQTFGRLAVVERAGTSPDRKALWRCRCACGNWPVVSGKDMRSGHVRSCGCLAVEATVRRNTRHGGAGTRLHAIWKDMHKRCRHHPHYAGRVHVDPAWASYPPFKAWALSHDYRPNLTLDRKDTLGHYSPDNCRWATRKQQAQNKYYGQSDYVPAT